MSYILEKPCTAKEQADFISLHNHQNGMKIEFTEDAIFALEENEIMIDNEPAIDEEYEAKKLILVKEEKLKECLKKAYEAEVNGTIFYKDAVFETNSTNISKLTAMLSMINANIIESVQ